MANSYKNAEKAVLRDYIPAERFRTIIPEYKIYPCGVSEIPAEIEIKRPFAETLSFFVEWDGVLYGFLRGKKELKALLPDFPEIKRVTLTDWDDHFLLLFEGEGENKEKPFTVTYDEVRELLESCRRSPEQAAGTNKQRKEG